MENPSTRKKRKTKNVFLGGFSAGFFNGLFGSGGGTLIVPYLETVCGLSAKKSHATAILIIVCLSPISLYFYGSRSFPDLSLCVRLALASSFGGLLGAKLLSRFSTAAVHKLFGLFLIIAGSRSAFLPR